MLSKNIMYRLLKEEEFGEVWRLLMEEYFTREPLTIAINFTPEERVNFFEGFVKDAAWHNVSYGAFDGKELVGVRLCLLGNKPLKYRSNDVSKLSLKPKQAIQFMMKIIGGLPAEVLGTEDYMQSFVLSSKSEYAKNGIGTELYRVSEEAARREGCKKIFTIASSAYTQRITAKLGYKDVKEICYKDYVDELTGEKIFEKIPEPHLKVTFTVKDL